MKNSYIFKYSNTVTWIIFDRCVGISKDDAKYCPSSKTMLHVFAMETISSDCCFDEESTTTPNMHADIKQVSVITCNSKHIQANLNQVLELLSPACFNYKIEEC